MSEVRIAWGMTAYGPIWAPAYTSHLVAIAYASRTLQVNFLGAVGAVACTDRQYTHAAENALVKDFLATEDYTHLFLTEQDMILPKDTIPCLLAVDQPVVSGLYFLRAGNGQPCLFQSIMTDRDNEYMHSPVRAFPQDRPFRVDCPGLGCVLLRREVFTRLAPPWFQLRDRVGDSGIGYGSDMYFYRHAKKAGIPVWVTPDVKCQQIDYYLVGYDDYAKRLANDPSFVQHGVIVGGRDGDTLAPGLRIHAS